MSVLKESQHLKIPLKEIEIATNNFEQCIGKGGYGMVFKGQLLIHGKLTTVAVKRLNEQVGPSGQGLKEFLIEVQLLTGQKHPNLIYLLGYCDEGKEKIIVYEYADHGSLDRYLTRNNTKYCLSWLERLKICVDAACGLDHLHNHVGKHQTIIHRDIKSSNILLDHNWVAKISDLGLLKLALSGLNRSSVVSHACGTHGYCEPEYISTGIVKKESDVYSFGMVLFEVLCGRLCFIMDDDGFLLSAPVVKDYYEKKKLDEIVDPALRQQMSFESMNKFSSIAYQCLHDDRAKRPSINLVMNELEELLKMELPSCALETQSRIRSRAMEIVRVSSIKLGGEGLPIEVRILRKWVLHLRQEDTCYLLVDQFGTGIIAVAHKDEWKYIETKLQTNSCYRIRDYVCVPADPDVNIIRHHVSLRVGAAAPIEILPDIDRLPRTYFEFRSYKDIEALLYYNRRPLIDFIGLILGKKYRAKDNSRDPYLRVTLSDSSGRRMVVTLWKEIITQSDRFDRVAIDNANVPSVLAVTSMRVKQFQEIIPQKGWFRNACPQCSQTIYESGKDWACPTHGRYNSPKHMFCITVKLADETGTVTATIFDEPMTTLLGTTCSDLINRDGFSDRASVPAPIQAIIGKRKRFFVQVQKGARTRSTRCIVNRVSDPVLQTQMTSLAAQVTPVPPPRRSGSAAVTTTSKRALFALPCQMTQSEKAK